MNGNVLGDGHVSRRWVINWTYWSPIDIEHNLRTAELRPMGEGRPAGLHLGQIIQAMRIAAGLPQGAPDGDQPGVRLAEGFLWEIACEYMLSGVAYDEAMELAFKRYMLHLRVGIVKQVQLVRDGIHMTPDALDPATGALESYKVTRKKMPHTQDLFEEKFWPWLVQEKAYCLAAGVDTVRWYVLFQAGDYSRGPGSGPKAVTSTGVFTPKELVENWKGVQAYAIGLEGK